LTNLESTNLTIANLKKYIKVDRKWRFVPVLKPDGVPYPATGLNDGTQPAQREQTLLRPYNLSEKRSGFL
jgi:hypothetical protein